MHDDDGAGEDKDDDSDEKCRLKSWWQEIWTRVMLGKVNYELTFFNSWFDDGGVCVDVYEGKFFVKALTNNLDGAQY